MKIAKEVGYSEIQASPIEGNSASTKVLTKMGFEIEEKNVEEESLHSGIRLSSRWIKRLKPNKALGDISSSSAARNSPA